MVRIAWLVVACAMAGCASTPPPPPQPIARPYLIERCAPVIQAAAGMSHDPVVGSLVFVCFGVEAMRKWGTDAGIPESGSCPCP